MPENNKVPQVVIDAVAQGKVVFFGEFRRGLAVEFSGKGGKTFHQTKCSVETETGTITVVEFLPDGADWKAWKPGFEKGQMVYTVCRSLDEQSGVQVANGKLHLAK